MHIEGVVWDVDMAMQKGTQPTRASKQARQGGAATEDNQQPIVMIPDDGPADSSRTIKGLLYVATSDVSHEETASSEAHGNEVDINSLLGDASSNPIAEKEVKLPKSDRQWIKANNFFKSVLFIDEIKESTLNNCCQKMSDTVYGYFEQFGFVENNRVMTNENPRVDPVDHDSLIHKSFREYAREFIDKSREKLPCFSMHECFSYFHHILGESCPNRTFLIPDWIPPVPTPSIQFSIGPPTYREITKIIQEMKTSGSPCLLDPSSVIAFKRSTYLRRYVTEIISQAWEAKTIPDTWKKAVTILTHEKDTGNDPSHFRPITLQCTALQVMTSFIRNRMFEFLSKNGYVEDSIQEGFTPNVAGKIEHTAHMAHLIRHAKRGKRALVITLIDLRNAFGDIHHNLINSVLEYHHIPTEMKSLISDLYSGFKTSVTTASYSTPFISIERGVLQGDCLSPLLLNMIFKTFIASVESQEFQQLGYQYDQNLRRRNWYQFADDAVILTGEQDENQLLLNAFTRWTEWATMIIRVDECRTFGIRKESSVMAQYSPKLVINGGYIPPVEKNQGFTYLGRFFDFKMTAEVHITPLVEKCNRILEDIEDLPLHPRYKIKLYSKFLLPKISWDLTSPDKSITWVKKLLNSISNGFIRKCLEIPSKGTLEIVKLSKERFGLDIIEISTVYQQCQEIKEYLSEQVYQCQFKSFASRYSTGRHSG